MELLINSKKFGSKVVLIDDEDFNKIRKTGKNYGLSLFRNRDNLYVRTSFKKRILLHRLIMNCPASKVVDHINHNTLDNRKCNLRICTHQENLRNQKSCKEKKEISYKGVFDRGKTYSAKICINGKVISINGLKTQEEAAKEYNKLALKYFGKFANLNKIKNNKNFIAGGIMTEKMQEERLWDIEDVKIYMGVKGNAPVFEMIARGLPAIKFGKKSYRFNPDSVKKFFNKEEKRQSA